MTPNPAVVRGGAKAGTSSGAVRQRAKPAVGRHLKLNIGAQQRGLAQFLRLPGNSKAA